MRRTDMKRNLKGLIVALVATALLVGCSSFTSIKRQAGGDYVITGWKTPGPVGFIWICDYDPQTKTLTVKEELPK
jgi:hypothetical protein